MKYTGSILITDASGEAAYERELSPDEIIEILIEDKASVQEVTQAEPKRQYKKRDTAEAGPAERKRKACLYCEQPGHMAKTCPKKRIEERAPDEPMSEEDFENVKQGKRDHLKPLQVASELNILLVEVNGAWDAIDYDWYIEHR